MSGNNVHGTLATGFTNTYTGSLMELDPNQIWVSSMAGFDTAAKAWWNSVSDSNAGSILVPRFDNTLYINTDATFEWWMNPDNSGASSGGTILKKYTGGNYNFQYKAGNIKFMWYRNGWQSVTDTSTIAINQWTHVAVTIDRGDTGSVVDFWINGQLSSSHTTNWLGSWDNQNVAMFNGNYSPLAGPLRQYTGMRDEVRVSDCIRYEVYSPPEVNVSSPSVTTYEEDEETITIQISLDSDWHETVTVPYTLSGTAEGGGVDYTDPTPASPVTFSPGQTSGNIQMTIIDDSEIDNNEMVYVTLNEPINAELGDTCIYALRICDAEEEKPFVLFRTKFSTADEDCGTATVEVLVSKVSSQTVTVPYALTGSAAGSGEDYTNSPSSPLTFGLGELKKDITFTVIDDGDTEETEAITITLGAPTNATLSKVHVHRLAIIDDDAEDTPPEWYDTFYPFRIPITVNVPAAGEYKLDLTRDTITDWMNEKADFQFIPVSFDYDSVKLVEIDTQGTVIKEDVDASYQIIIGGELISSCCGNG